MTDMQYKNTLYEVDEVLKLLNEDLVTKIPLTVREYIRNNKAKYYKFEVEKNKKISEQKIMKTTEQYLSMLYLKFICNENEKNIVLEKMINNKK